MTTDEPKFKTEKRFRNFRSLVKFLIIISCATSQLFVSFSYWQLYALEERTRTKPNRVVTLDKLWYLNIRTFNYDFKEPKLNLNINHFIDSYANKIICRTVII